MIALKDFGQPLPDLEFYQQVRKKYSSGGLFTIAYDRSNPHDVEIWESSSTPGYEEHVKKLQDFNTENHQVAHLFIKTYIQPNSKSEIERHHTHTVNWEDTGEVLSIFGDGEFKKIGTREGISTRKFSKFLFEVFGDDKVSVVDTSNILNKISGFGDYYVTFCLDSKKGKSKLIHNIPLDEKYGVYMSNDAYNPDLTYTQKAFVTNVAAYLQSQDKSNKKSLAELIQHFTGLTDKQFRAIMKEYNIPSV